MKKLLSTILLAILYTSAMAYDFSAVCSTGQTLFYNITSDVEPYTVEVTSENTSSPYYTSYPIGELVIPESVTYNDINYSVTIIGTSAFFNCSGLTEITISNSITSIGQYAFCECSGLTEITIPNSVTSISNYAFSNCSGLTSVTIPSSVTSIGYGAFDRVRNITYSGAATGSPWGALTVNGYVDGYLVYSDNTKTNLTGCSTLATEVTIPNSVISIGESAFIGCEGLTSVTIPNSVTSIGREAFSHCSGLSGEINIPNSVTNIDYGTFSGCSGLTSVIIGNGVMSIGDYAFSGCRGMTELTIGNSVTSIGDYTFSGCSGLTSVTVPNSVSSIGNCAFYGCSELTEPIYNANCFAYFPCGYATEYTIPDGIQQICGSAFKGCYELTSVTISNYVTNIGEEAFSGCSGLTEITIPNSVTSIGKSAFNYCNGLAELTIGNSVTSIGSEAFHSCSGLTSVTIPNSVTSIGSAAFHSCSGLTSVTIPNSVMSIGESAFYNCNNLQYNEYDGAYYLGNDENQCVVLFKAVSADITSCNIKNSCKFIYESAFNGCSGLTSVTIPNSVTSIGGSAFEGCRGLTEFTIPESVTSIGSTLINMCDSLKTVNFNCMLEESPQIYYLPLTYGNSSIEVVNIGENVTYIPFAAFSYFSGLITINYNATNCISSFIDNTNLTNLSIGENVESIPDSAFNGCTDISEIYTHTNTPPVLGSNIFSSDILSTATVWTPCQADEYYRNADGWNLFTNIQNDTTSNLIVTVQSQNEAMGNVTGSGNYSCEAETTITATPNQGYQFVSWNDDNTDNPRNITITGDTTFVASFRAVEYWSCDFEGDEIWTFGNDQQDGNVLWQIVTPETYPEILVPSTAGAYLNPFVFNGDTLSNTPDHWAMVEIISQLTDLGGSGQVAESPWIQFEGIDLSEAVHPQITFRQIFRQLNGVETLIRVSVDGGQTWTEHILNEKVESNKYGQYTISKGVSINEAAGEENVMIRFLFNSDAHTTQMGYGWEIDDIEIVETPQYDLTLQEARISMFGYIDYRNIPDEFQPTVTDQEQRRENAYQYYDPYAQSTRNQWATENGYAAFNVEVSSYGYDTVTPTARVKITNPNGVEIYNKEASCTHALSVNEGDTLDFFNSASFYFEGIESYRDVTVGRYTVDFYVFAEGRDDADESDNHTTQYFDITYNTFSMSYDEPTGYFYNSTYPANEYGISFTYNYQPENTIEVDVYIDEHTTVGAMAKVLIYEYNEEGVPVEIGSSDTLVIASDMLGTWVNFPLNDYVNSDTTFMVAIMGILNDGEYLAVGSSDVLTSNAHKSYLHMNDSWYYGSQQLAIRVREVRELIEYNIVVLSNNDSYGTVSGGGTYEEGSSVLISAMPYSGYNFVSWDDGDELNPRTIVVTSDSTFIAEFEKCEITQTIDTTVNNFVTVGDHTYYSTGNYMFTIPTETGCDTIFDIHLRVLAEPVYDISPNPTKSLLDINSNGFISTVEFYSVTGQLVMRKEVNSYEAVFDMKELMNGVYILRIYDKESSLPSMYKVVKE